MTTGITVTPWRRYGLERLYVKTAEGEPIGWLDPQTGEASLDREDLRQAFETALSQHLGTLPMAPAGPSRTNKDPAQDIEPYSVRLPFRDLARNHAGESARRQASQERAAAPVRTAMARILQVHTAERAWRIGADGEIAVARCLEQLSQEWHSIHAVAVGRRNSDIDHVVVGPPGVFTINTKHHPGKKVTVDQDRFTVNGYRQQYVRNSRHEAARASRLLSQATGEMVAVTGVIAVVGAHNGFEVRRQPDDVHVVGRRALVGWLTSLPHRLNPEDVQRISRTVRRSDTWAC